MNGTKIIFLMASIFLCSCTYTKNSSSEIVKINVELKNKLETIYLKDQGIREIVMGKLSDIRKAELLKDMNISESDIEGNKIYDLIGEIDSTNLIAIESIIKQYGYPSKSLVGEPANKAAFYVIQHSDKIDEYLPLMREATKNGDIEKVSLAMMEDRSLMYKGQEQIYGTQIKGQPGKDGHYVYFIWPVKSIDSVNVFRKNVGFKQSIEEYSKEKGIDFKLYKLDELKDL